MKILPRVGVAVHREDLGREARVNQQHVAGLDDDIVGSHDLFELGAVDGLEVVTEVMRDVDEHAAPLHAVERHVFEAEVVRERNMRTAVAARVLLRTNEINAGAVAVVVDGFFDTVAVGVELGTDVARANPIASSTATKA